MLISEEYKKQQQVMHENPEYGVASVTFAPLVTQLINKLQVSQLLDYGMGKGRLAEALKPDNKLSVFGYDPGIEGYDDPPEPTEMVACIDVLEHIEPELIDNVLDDLQRVTQRVGFFSIHTGPAVKVLPDGRNAHLIQEGYEWWLPKIWSRFNVQAFQQVPNGFYVVVRAHGLS